MKIFTPRKNRRGALQLSINAIVVLILAITMLGLGLGFIRGMFGSTIEQFQALAGQLEEEDRNTLEQSPDEITFLSSKIKMSGRDKTVYFAVRNNQGVCKKFAIQDSFDCYDAISSDARSGVSAVGADNDVIKFETYATRDIGSTESSVMPVTITASPATLPTIYSCRLRIPWPDTCEGATPEEGDVDTTSGTYHSYEFEIDYSK